MKLLPLLLLLPAGLLLWPHGDTGPRTPSALPLAFERNLGQVPDRFDYLARSAASSVALGRAGAEISSRTRRVSLEFAGGRAREPVAGRRLPGIVNHLVGDDPARWRTGIPTFERVRYPGVWPGVDVEWHGGEDGLEYDFLVAPGADPGRIALRFSAPVRLTARGDLEIDRAIRQRAPRAFQGEREVTAAYVLDGGTVRLRLGAYDRTRPLLIDPVVIAYSTYLGGGSTDLGYQIAVDPIGQAYVTGVTASANFNTAGQIEGDSPGTDAFIAKLNPAGDTLAYSTYLGGSADDEGTAITVDDQGFAYVAGTTTSTDFNTTAGALQGNRPGRDTWVAKLNPTGNTLAFSTYLGGGGDDRSGVQIAIDSTRSVYVTGITSSTDFPTSDVPIQANKPGDDGFVAKLNPTGTALGYGTYLGGNAADGAQGIAVDAIGEAYVVGQTDSTDFSVVGGVGGDQDRSDAFVTKLNPAGTALAYSTYLGGDGNDFALTVAVDSAGFAYLTGATDSTDFPAVDAFQPQSAGTTDAFVAKLNPAGDTLAYSTYLGGRHGDRGNTIGIDSTGSAYIVGETNSPDFPLALQHEACTATHDAFVVKLAPTGDRLSHSTCIGGQLGDSGNGLAVHPTGMAFITGTTESADFDVKGAIEGDNAGPLPDAFITKLAFTSAPPAPTPTAPASPTPTGTPTPGGAAGPSGTASPSGTAAPSSPAPSGTATPSGTAAPPRPRPPAPPNLGGAPRSASVDGGGRFRYSFRAMPGVAGTATFVARRRTLARQAFTVPASGRVTLRPQLARPTGSWCGARGSSRCRRV